MRATGCRDRAERASSRRPGRRSTAAIVGVLVTLSVFLGSGTGFAAGSGGRGADGRRAVVPPDPSAASSSPRLGLTASWVPTDKPIVATPGTTVTGRFWVTNRGDDPVTVHVKRATALPRDNGRLRLSRAPDPRFPGVRLSAETLVIAPHATSAVEATVDVPSLAPGVYILPFVVRPEVTKSQIVVVTEVSALVTLRVPGKLTEHVRAWFVGGGWRVPGLPLMQLGTYGTQTLRVLDDSPATVSSFNEITVGGGFLGGNTVVHHTTGLPENRRHDTRLFFPNRSRDYQVRWEPPALGIGVGHLKAVVSYHLTPTRLGSVTVTRDVLVIAPWWLLAIALAEGLVLIRVARRARRLLGPRTGHPPRRGEQLRDIGVTVVTGLVGLLLWALGGFVIVAVTLFGLALATLPVVRDTRDRWATGNGSARERTRSRKVRTSAQYLRLAIGAELLAIVAGALLTIAVLVRGWSTTGAVAVLAAAAVWLCVGAAVIQRVEGLAPRRVGRRAHHATGNRPRRAAGRHARRGAPRRVAARR